MYIYGIVYLRNIDNCSTFNRQHSNFEFLNVLWGLWGLSTCQESFIRACTNFAASFSACIIVAVAFAEAANLLQALLSWPTAVRVDMPPSGAANLRR